MGHARDVAMAIDDDRCGKSKVIVMDAVGDGADDENDAIFWDLLGGKVEDLPDEAAEEAAPNPDMPTVLWRLSDSEGELATEEVARDMGEDGGAITTDLLDENDVFFLWSPKCETFFAWVGARASDRERRNAMFFAETALRQHGLSPATCVQRVTQGFEPSSFKNAI